MWSRAPSPYVSIKIDVGADVWRRSASTPRSTSSRPLSRPAFRTPSRGRLGAEYRLNKRFSARAGAFYRPTPVPKQNVPGTNILDGTTIGGTVGLGFNFDDPLEIFAAPITIDLAAMAPRRCRARR